MSVIIKKTDFIVKKPMENECEQGFHEVVGPRYRLSGCPICRQPQELITPRAPEDEIIRCRKCGVFFEMSELTII